MLLAPLYFRRLGLVNTKSMTTTPDINTLSSITRAHLSEVPFENLAQHGCNSSFGPACLDSETLADKILRHGRGGFCFELNGLLSEFLIELGYGVRRIPARVYMGDVGEYSLQATHMILAVTVPETFKNYAPDLLDSTPCTHLVDVGFGEPSIEPLRYSFDEEQCTSDGMRSRLIRSDEENVVLEWWREDLKDWKPRLMWEARAAEVPLSKSPALSDFQPALDAINGPDSSFSRKLIVCKLTNEEKLSLAGSTLRRTGPPRFGDARSVPVVHTELESEGKVREALHDHFGIEMEECTGLNLTKSHAAPEGLWSK